MKKYFFSDGTNVQGPYFKRELKEIGITKESLIWFVDLEGWERAGNVNELQDLFDTDYQIFHKLKIFRPDKAKQDRGSSIVDLLIILSICCLIINECVKFIFNQIDGVLNSPLIYLYGSLEILLSFVPLVLSIAVRNRVLRILSISVGILLTGYFLYSNIIWVMSVL